MAPSKNTLKHPSFCHVASNNDFHVEITWPFEDFGNRKGGSFSTNYEVPLKTDKGGRTSFEFCVGVKSFTFPDQYYVILDGRIFTENMKFTAEVCLTDKEGNKKMLGSSHKIMMKSSGLYSFKSPSLQSDTFIAKGNENSTISCNIMMNHIEPVDDKDDRIVKLLMEGREEHSDVVLVCVDGEVECHKSIITLNSQYFKVTTLKVLIQTYP